MSDMERTAYESFRAQYTKEDFDRLFCGKSVITVWSDRTEASEAIASSVSSALSSHNVRIIFVITFDFIC